MIEASNHSVMSSWVGCSLAEYTKTLSLATFSIGALFSRYVIDSGKKSLKVIGGVSLLATAAVIWNRMYSIQSQSITYIACLILGMAFEGCYRFMIGRSLLEKRCLDLGFAQANTKDMESLKHLELTEGTFYGYLYDNEFRAYIALNINGKILLAKNLQFSQHRQITQSLLQLGMISREEVERMLMSLGGSNHLMTYLATESLVQELAGISSNTFVVITGKTIQDKKRVDNVMNKERYSLVDSDTDCTVLYKKNRKVAVYFEVNNDGIDQFKENLQNALNPLHLSRFQPSLLKRGHRAL